MVQKWVAILKMGSLQMGVNSLYMELNVKMRRVGKKARESLVGGGGEPRISRVFGLSILQFWWHHFSLKAICGTQTF